MSEVALICLQGAALRVVVVKPAGTSFQGTRGDGFLLLQIRPGRRLLPPVSNVHPPTFHSEDLVVVLEQRLKASTLLL